MDGGRRRRRVGRRPRDAAAAAAVAGAATGGHVPAVLAAGRLAEVPLARAVAAAWVNHLGGGGGGDNDGAGGPPAGCRRAWPQAARVALFARYAAAGGHGALGREAAAVAAALGLAPPPAAALPRPAPTDGGNDSDGGDNDGGDGDGAAALRLAGAVMDAAATGRGGAMTPALLARLARAGWTPEQTVGVVGCAAFFAYLQRLWVVTGLAAEAAAS